MYYMPETPDDRAIRVRRVQLAKRALLDFQHANRMARATAVLRACIDQWGEDHPETREAEADIAQLEAEYAEGA